MNLVVIGWESHYAPLTWSVIVKSVYDSTARTACCWEAGMATLLLLSRFLGAKDMGSNFYPFTAARKGNKLVTKGLFSKLAACMIR